MSDLMPPSDPMARSGARWCESHKRWECAANKHNHHASAIRGLAYCVNCNGRTRAAAKALGAANMLAWSMLPIEGVDAPVMDPAQVVLNALRQSVMRAEIYAERLRLQLEEDEREGLVGRTYAAGRDGARVETGEAVRSLAKLEAEERDRAVRYAKVAHDMGIDARRLELEEAQAGQVVAAAGAGLDAAELTPVQRDAFLSAFLGALGVPVDLDTPPDDDGDPPPTGALTPRRTPPSSGPASGAKS